MSNLIKSGFVTYDRLEKRVINSDRKSGLKPLILERIQEIPEPEDESEVEDGPDMEALKQQAEALLIDARRQSENIIKEAKLQARALKDQALLEGKEKGYREGKKKAEKEIKQLEQQLQEQIQRTQEEYEEQIQSLEPQFAEVLIGLLYKLTNCLIEDKKDIVIYLINQALTGIERSRNFIIHVSKEDYGFVVSHSETIKEKVGNKGEMEIIEDVSLEQNQCLIEADSKIIDCSLDVQLEELTKNIQMLAIG